MQRRCRPTVYSALRTCRVRQSHTDTWLLLVADTIQGRTGWNSTWRTWRQEAQGGAKAAGEGGIGRSGMLQVAEMPGTTEDGQFRVPGASPFSPYLVIRRFEEL